MRYVKTLGLVAVAAIAALAFAATALATTITSPEGTPYTKEIVAEAVSGGVTVHGVSTFTCQKSIAAGTVEQHGSSVTAEGQIASWNLSECGNVHLDIQGKGHLTVHQQKEGSTVTSSGVSIDADITSLGIHCVFSTENTDLGLLTGSGSNVTLAVDIPLPRTGGSLFCGNSTQLTANYVITTPSTLYID